VAGCLNHFRIKATYSGGVRIGFDWCCYLSLAKDLASDNKDEARLRSSISRAYYAAFCTARNYLRDVEQKAIPDENVHSYVIGQFYALGRRNNGKKLAMELRRLRNDRNRADYDDSVGGLPFMCNDALIRAERVISYLKK
jgi:uncharacterized protein (UPF0332 family)